MKTYRRTIKQFHERMVLCQNFKGLNTVCADRQACLGLLCLNVVYRLFRMAAQISFRFNRSCNVTDVETLLDVDILGRTNFPAGIWCENDVGSTSMRRHHVPSTLKRRYFGTKCPLGYCV